MDFTQCPLFRHLSNERVHELIRLGVYQFRSFGREDVLAIAGERCNTMMVLTQGSVRGEMPDGEGRFIKIEDIEAPNPLAPAFVFGHQNTFPVTIVANTEVELLAIPRETLLRMLQADKQLLVNYLDMVSNRAQFLSAKLNFLSFNSIKGKIALYLIDLAKNLGTDFELPKSHTELAALFGVARPSLTRALRELHNAGVLVAQGRQIRVVDMAALKAHLKQ